MKKIGILTHYHNTTNYGGALQAYALCKILNNQGYDCEQIDIDFTDKMFNLRTGFLKQWLKSLWILKPVKLIYKKLRKKVETANSEQAVLKMQWEIAFAEFLYNLIPHSDQMYNTINIDETLSYYDVFITGSDQVWNPLWYYEPFFLTFVTNDKKKLSYAASISQKELTRKEEVLFSLHLESFDAISVRESNAIDLLADVTDKPVEHVLDPTLLLSLDDWNAITAERVVDGPYAYCYFLGDDDGMRHLANAYAKNKNIKLVNIKHVCGIYHYNDLQYGDFILDTSTPNEFLSLIKHADIVFTDSFHASVFSIIFESQFFCFSRSEFSGMETRLESLLELFELEERYQGKVDLRDIERILQIEDIHYPLQSEKYELEKEKSLEFLRRSIG